MGCWIIFYDHKKQGFTANSFIGGYPKLPTNTPIPVCRLCSKSMTFFLQLALPMKGEWEGYSVAVFQCTSCADDKNIIPRMVDIGGDISQEFVEGYESNFCFIPFKTSLGELRSEYEVKVKFVNINYKYSLFCKPRVSHIGGKPNWVIRKETPGKLLKKFDFTFLFQLNIEKAFETVQGSPRQVVLSYDGFGGTMFSPIEQYELFASNRFYFFGAISNTSRFIYMVTQKI